MIRYYVKSTEYSIITVLYHQWRRWKINTLNVLGFPDWMMLQYKCTISYHYNSTAINYFSFQSDKDLNWFLLNI